MYFIDTSRAVAMLEGEFNTLAIKR
jgi:hypothetical protein